MLSHSDRQACRIWYGTVAGGDRYSAAVSTVLRASLQAVEMALGVTGRPAVRPAHVTRARVGPTNSRPLDPRGHSLMRRSSSAYSHGERGTSATM